jgi:hypothetical protein
VSISASPVPRSQRRAGSPLTAAGSRARSCTTTRQRSTRSPTPTATGAQQSAPPPDRSGRSPPPPPPARRRQPGRRQPALDQARTPTGEVLTNPLRQHPRPAQPVTHRRRRQPKLRRDLPEINPASGQHQSPTDHLNRIKPPAQTSARQKHMPRQATRAIRPPRTHRRNPARHPHRPQPRITPRRHRPTTARAPQPPRAQLALDYLAVGNYDQQRRCSGIRPAGPSRRTPRTYGRVLARSKTDHPPAPPPRGAHAITLSDGRPLARDQNKCRSTRARIERQTAVVHAAVLPASLRALVAEQAAEAERMEIRSELSRAGLL